MAEDGRVRRFVVAVFRDHDGLSLAVRRLREAGFAAKQLLIVESPAVSGAAPVDGDGIARTSLSLSASADLGTDFRDLLQELGSADGTDATAAAARPAGTPLYNTLPQELAAGASVLILHVIDPNQQLLGARIALAGNSHYVLTHELPLTPDRDGGATLERPN